MLALCTDDPEDMGKKIQKVLDEQQAPFEMALLKPDTEAEFFPGFGESWNEQLPATWLFDGAGKKRSYTNEKLTREVLDKQAGPLLGAE